MGFVFIISSLVILYSDYMFGDLNIIRSISLVLIFVVSIMFLIVSPNVISILLGWYGLGLVSYLFVIYYQNVRSYGAGVLTVLSHRIGTACLPTEPSVPFLLWSQGIATGFASYILGRSRTFSM